MKVNRYIARAGVGLLMLTAITAVGCGYRFTGAGSLPGGVTRVFVSLYENRTSESGVETCFTDDMTYEFMRSGSVKVVDQDEAEAVLTGVVHSLQFETAAHQGVHSSLERRVTLSVDIQMVDRSGRLIWSADDVNEAEEYAVADKKLGTEQNRRTAIETISEKIAETVYNRLTERF